MAIKLLDIRLLQKSHLLELQFEDGKHFSLSCAYLRTYSPSAEVRYQEKDISQEKHKNVNIIAIEPVGHYAIKLIFDDGHNTGIYTWEGLYELGLKQPQYWPISEEK